MTTKTPAPLTAYQLAALRALVADPAAHVEPATLSLLRKRGLAGRHVTKANGRQKTTSPATPAGIALAT